MENILFYSEKKRTGTTKKEEVIFLHPIDAIDWHSKKKKKNAAGAFHSI